MSVPEERAASGVPARETYAVFCCGADITALVALLVADLGRDPGRSFLVFYGNDGQAPAGALEELLSLKDRYIERLALHFIMEREAEEGELLNGRLDASKLRALAGVLFEPRAVGACFVTGTGSVAAQLRAALQDLGVEPQRIRAVQDEPIVAASDAPRATALPAAAQAGLTQVDVIMDGRRRAFSMRTGQESILEAATRAGIDLPFSCRAGVCSTCRTKLVRGEVELAQNYALEDWELAQGFILACQAHAKTAELEITYDET